MRADRQTDRQTDRHTHKQADMLVTMLRPLPFWAKSKYCKVAD